MGAHEVKRTIEATKREKRMTDRFEG